MSDLLAHNPLGNAAAYARMSTDNQKYSIENQLCSIAIYAQQTNLSVVDTYIDHGKSGLTFQKRDGLKRLIGDILEGRATFKNILVLDVSRWGRFQNTDESAHYEYLCNNAGVKIHYVAEQFQNDGTSLSAILKSLKRVMAAEYSHDLSLRIFNAKSRMAVKGYFQGGIPGYGLRRMVIDCDGKIKRTLKPGERKGLQSDRVVLRLGPEREVRTVNWIYRKFLEPNISETDIAQLLNRRGIKLDSIKLWTRERVLKILKSERYLGHLTLNKISTKLGKKPSLNAPEQWIRYCNAFSATVSQELFNQVQNKFYVRAERLSDEEVLNRLHKLRRKKGKLTQRIINYADGIPSTTSLQLRFGSVSTAYKRIGYAVDPTVKRGLARRASVRIWESIRRELAKTIRKKGYTTSIYQEVRTPLLVINGVYRISFLVCRYWLPLHENGPPMWIGDFGLRKETSDFVVGLHLNAENKNIERLYLIPSHHIDLKHAVCTKVKMAWWEQYECKTLETIRNALIRHIQKHQ